LKIKEVSNSGYPDFKINANDYRLAIEEIKENDEKAKISLNLLKRVQHHKQGKLILVTTINPTASGEGKTTITIGLAQALTQLGKKTMLGIREPSMGPIMGKKGVSLPFTDSVILL
jgi:formyltetrahydrofolate synthetase